MAAFAFYTMSQEDQAALRENLRRCVALLDERLLQAFHLVQQSHEGYQYEGAFDQICQRAGLLHSDAGLLAGRVQTLFQTREPILYEAEAYAILHQWLHNKEAED